MSKNKPAESNENKVRRAILGMAITHPSAKGMGKVAAKAGVSLSKNVLESTKKRVDQALYVIFQDNHDKKAGKPQSQPDVDMKTPRGRKF